MKNYRKIQKGTVIGWDWFYVVVEIVITDGKAYCHCICDNANNSYSFSIDEILQTTEPHKHLIISPIKAISRQNWDSKLTDEDEKIFLEINREIPMDVIAEVLSGKHDDRWNGDID